MIRIGMSGQDKENFLALVSPRIGRVFKKSAKIFHAILCQIYGISRANFTPNGVRLARENS